MVYDEVRGEDNYDFSPTLYTLCPEKPTYYNNDSIDPKRAEEKIVRNNGPPKILISIKYTDNSVIYLSPEEWSQVGVDEIIISNPLPINGHSIYWFYKENDYYVLGCANTYRKDIIPEVLFTPSGEQISRPIKLGWWRVGVERNG